MDLEITRGTVHALVGENGAGKSTLGKIIGGAIRHDEGTLRIEGEEKTYRSPHDALADGVSSIQQEIALVPGRSVIENVFLGMEFSRFGFPSPRRMKKRFDEVQSLIGFDLSPNVMVGSLSVANQQKAEILRAVVRDSKVIVMDEPTAALGPNEVRGLLDTIERLKEGGTTIIFVSHRLDEVKAVSDEVTVLRNGKLVGTWNAAEISTSQIVEQMLGRSLADTFPEIPPPPADDAPVVLKVENLSQETLVEDVSFELRAGEILGVAGLVGSGRSEMVRAIFGAERHSGAIQINGEPVQIKSPSSAVDAGLALLPESRKDEGLVMLSSIKENLTLAQMPRLKSWWGGLKKGDARRLVNESMESLDIRPRKPERAVNTLSGGNQQKVLFGKWLATEPKVFIADEPTRGVDIGAKFAIYEVLVRLAREGMGVLVISSELEEILGIAHRVLVMRNGKLVADLPRANATEEAVIHAAFGTEGATAL